MFKKLFKNRYFALVISSFLFILLQLLTSNLQLYFRDEGFLLNSAMMILHGMAPYRDFFLTTTPGAFYLQALLFKIFGQYMILDRILYVLIILGIFFLVLKIFKLKPIPNLIALLLMAFAFAGPNFAFYNIEGLFLFLLSLLELKIWRKSKKNLFTFFLGLTTFLIFFFKQSYGLSNFIIILISIIYLAEKKNLIKNLFIYILGLCVGFLPYATFLYLTNSLSNFLFYIFYFAKTVKAHRLPFVLTFLLFIPLYLGILKISRQMTLKKRVVFLFLFSLFFLTLYLLMSPSRAERLFTILHDPLIYYYLGLIIFPLTVIFKFFRSKRLSDKEPVVFSLFLLAIFYAGASSGRDYTTVLMSLPFAIPLFILTFTKIKNKKIGASLLILVLVCFVIPFVFTNLNFLFKSNTHNTHLKLDQTKGLSVDKSKAIELNEVISYIESKTNKNDKILCFPYCPLIYFLSQRLSASYFSFFYQETFLSSNQQETISDIKKNKTKLIIIQRKGLIEPEAEFEDKRLAELKTYFVSNFILIKKTENFYFYSPNN